MKVTCTWTGKRAYGTRLEAQRHALRIERQTGEHYEPYRCPDCGCYHLTTKRAAA